MRQVNFAEAMELWAKPERLVLVTSYDSNNEPHIMTVGWKMRASFRPPILAVAIGHARRMNSMIKESKEFVVAVPGADLAKETLACGLGKGEQDRFKAYGFEQKTGNFVKAPLIEKCIVCFECKLHSQIETGDHSIFFGEVMASWINENPTKNLVLTDDSAGYNLLAEEGAYKIGIVSN